MSRPTKAANAALVILILALVAAVVGTAAAGPDEPTTAQTSASTKRIALSALKQAKRARRAARAARRVAKAALAMASQAQGSANNAQTAASQAQGAASQAQGAAAQAQTLTEQATIGRSAYSLTCNPASAVVFIDCVETTLNLPRSGRVLLTAAGGQASGGVPTHGLCRLEVDDSTATIPNPAALRPGEVVTDNTDGNAQNGFAITAVTDILPTGLHMFEMSCNEEVGDLAILHSTITAVMIGAG